MSAPLPHRMRLSIRKRSSLNAVERAKTEGFPGQDCLVVRCDCMAQINDQDRAPDAVVPWGFWAFDYIALIPLTTHAQPIFDQHVAEYDARRSSQTTTRSTAA